MKSNRKRFVGGIVVALVIILATSFFVGVDLIGLLIGILVGATIAKVSTPNEGLTFGVVLGLIAGPTLGVAGALFLLQTGRASWLTALGVVTYSFVTGAVGQALVCGIVGAGVGWVARRMQERGGVMW